VAYEIVVIGASLGGLRALDALLAGLPADFPLPVVVAQHRSSDSDDLLGVLLQRGSPLPVCEAEDKQVLAPGCVYLSPANYHLLVEKGHLALSTEAPVMYARPSIDILFESAAAAYAQGVIGVLLTGASADGAQGLAEIKMRGGMVLVQEPATAQSPVMPEAALAASEVDRVLPLSDIAPFLMQRVLER